MCLYFLLKTVFLRHFYSCEHKWHLAASHWFFIIFLALRLGFISQEVLQQENYSLEEQKK